LARFFEYPVQKTRYFEYVVQKSVAIFRGWGGGGERCVKKFLLGQHAAVKNIKIKEQQNIYFDLHFISQCSLHIFDFFIFQIVSKIWKNISEKNLS